MAEILYELAAEILKNLGSLAVQEVGSIWGLSDELRKLSGTVSSIQAVLIDAEEQQQSSHGVRDWTRKLKKVFFEADDLLDDFATQVTHRKLVSKVSIFFSKSNPVLYNHKISKRLKAIRENLDVIAKDKASLNLVERRQPLLLESNLDRETSSFVPDGEVIGRNDDRTKILDFLMNSEVNENVAVISIVGLGGLGKTTLAQSVYNNEMVQEKFDKRLWVCVSDVFDVKVIAEKIVESAGGGKNNFLQLDAVQKQLREMLDGKKYLLVLDDMWNEDALKWSRLKNMLIGGAKGSKILVTTRSDVVAEVSGSIHQHKLGDLSEEEAWALFEKMAFECNNESENSSLVEIGKEIVKKCGGVPLAIRSVGSLLRLKRTEDEWIYFKNQDLSSITRGGDNVMAILRLSYNHLPHHLKICFAYCSLFPKDFRIDRVDLIDMWIAQGFIQSTISNRDNVEDVANSYFVDMLRRSFFQETKEHKSFPDFYKMHDLIHDLAKEVADREFFSITKTEDTEIVIPEQTLHASCLFQVGASLEFPSPFYRKHMKLRTFIYLDGSKNVVIRNSTLEGMVSSFECLRILHLRRLEIKFLPQSLGGLKHLRYLAISSRSIVTLPNSITKLHNLQVLKLVDCIKLKKLPRDIWRLVSLRRLVCLWCASLTHIPPGLWQLASLIHLDFDGCKSLEDMPPGIDQLTSLRTLTSFIVGKESCISGLASDKLNELKGLDLRNRLRIKFMGRARAIGETIPTDVVKRMKHLRYIWVEFERGNQENDTGADLIKLEALQPHQNIERLRIENYSASRFPSWLMVDNLGFLLPKLVFLQIRDCHKCQKLPPLWQLRSLQNLVLLNLDVVESIDGLEGNDDKSMLRSNTPTDERYFPSLKRLYLGIISEKILKQILCPPHHPSPLCNLNRLTLVSIEDLATMPEDVFKSLTSLQSLSIYNCRNLVSLSTCLTHLTSLESLCIENCPLLDLSNEEAMQFEVPGNLSTFKAFYLDKLMSLPVWLQHFSGTLKSIEIWECPNLTSIPEWIGDLIALNWLEIYGSRMLTSFPEGMRSLAALQVLIVTRCSSSLKQRCEKEGGEDWPKIAHIPRVDIREGI
ncbi:putative disease resistance protein RGA3 [Nicotiana sylvestris]|uniref:Disease resistance protein RGA3 n=1 Tax=Nicotiana sylvestris TaxID=4096 RepID=A0A1U7YAQ9_NICSY|nr:PREDICTED: putative disease resistance protein RGA3 [Nicotiana sylvestris]